MKEQIHLTVCGVVEEDTDDDDEGDAPVENATVRLDDGNGNVITTTTDPDGSFSFEGVEPGEYTVELEIPAGFVVISDSDDGDLGTVDADADEGDVEDIASVSYTHLTLPTIYSV